MLAKRHFVGITTLACGRACVSAAAVFTAALAYAQVAPPERPQRPARAPTPRMIPRGTVVTFTNETLTISNPVRMQGMETTFPVNSDAVISSLKPIKRGEITEPKWATVYRQPGPAGSEEILVMWLKVGGAQPENDATGKGPLPPVNLRRDLSGMLKMNGTNATLQ